MTTNISKKKRDELMGKIAEIRDFINNAADDENKVSLLKYIADIEKDIGTKKYGLVFEEHREEIDSKLEENTPVLTEEEKLFIDKGGEINFLIEGDNLASLRLLEKTHRGKIDLIYIDPPYNTGNKDFVYGDSFVDQTDTFRHSKWLSFMSKRLPIAKRLLSEKGVIFISIDDNEQAQLKILCDEVFGESNFAAVFPWRKRTAKSDVPHGISQDYEWILCYAKGDDFKASVKGKERKYYETPDFPGRPWRTHDMTKQTTASERPNSYFTMINPKTGDEYPCDPNRTWRVTKDTFKKYYDANEIIFPGDYPFLKISKPVARYFKDNDMKKDGEDFGRVPLSTKLPDEVGMSQDGTKEIKEIFDNIVFSFPKSTKLLKYLIEAATKESATVLDFFAGSGTTGHAVLKLNAEDGGNRRFILCTNNENNICRDVTYERIKRVIEKEDYKASIKYFRVGFVPVTERKKDGSLSERLFFEYADELLKHVKELVELENGINFKGNSRIAIVLTEKELEDFISSLTKDSKCKVVYLSHGLIPSRKQEQLLIRMGISKHIIPEYYFKELEG